MPSGTPISITIICKNAADTIKQCIEACLKVSNDVIVVDSYSNDGTQEIISQSGATLIQSPWLGYGATKNFAAEQAKHDWILSIDADEVLSDTLIQSINQLSLAHDTIYQLDRMTNYCGTWVRHSGWYPDWISRLYPKDHVQWNLAAVHEQLIVPDNYTYKKLPGLLHHYSYRTEAEHLEKIDRYAQLAAKRDLARGKKLSIAKRYLGPSFRFIKSYLLKKGFLDGNTGYTLARKNAGYVKKYISYYDRLVTQSSS